MSNIQIKNFIDGKEIDSFSKEKVKIKSPFYDYEIEIPNSDPTDLAMALSSAKKAQEQVDKLSLIQRAQIVERAPKNFHASEEEIEYAVKMLGVPKKTILQKIENIKYMLEKLFENSKKRYNYIHHEFLHHHFDEQAFVYKRPLDKLASCFIPGNDISVSAFVFAHNVLSGSRIIAKPSKEEPYFTIKTAKALTDAGYPKGAINVLMWDSTDKNRKHIAHALIAETQSRIVFGDDSTLQTLRFQEVGEETKDHGIKGSFVLYGTGRSKAIVDKNVDPKKIAESLTEGSLSYYIGCTSTKAAFIHESIYEQLTKHLVTAFSKKTVDDPLNPNTDIGFSKETKLVMERIQENERFGLIKSLNGSPELKNEFQFKKPLIIEVSDINSEFLKNEYAVPILGLFKYSGSFSDGVKLLNEASFISEDYYKSIAISVYTESVEKNMNNILKINAHHININSPTTFQHIGLPHQSKYLKDELTEDISISVF